MGFNPMSIVLLGNPLTLVLFGNPRERKTVRRWTGTLATGREMRRSVQKLELIAEIAGNKKTKQLTCHN